MSRKNIAKMIMAIFIETEIVSIAKSLIIFVPFLSSIYQGSLRVTGIRALVKDVEPHGR